MFYSYTGSEHKNIIDRFSIHQINAPSFCCYLSLFCYKKETWGYAKVIHKKEEELRKNGQVFEIFKTMGT
jgi:hypothetical protein